MRKAAPVLLVALLAALGAGALLPPVGAARPAPGGETTFFLAATSLARDFDLRYDESDRERFLALWGEPPEGVEVVDRQGSERFAAPAAPAALAAPALRLAPRRGLRLAGVLALAVAVTLAWRALARRLEAPAAAGILFVALAGSIAFHAPFRAAPAALVAALILSALALAALARPRSRTRLTAVYDGPEPGAVRSGTGRYLLAGLLCGLAVSADLTLLPLFVALPLLGGVTGRARRRAALVAGLGALGSLVAVGLLAGAPWEAPQPVADGALLFWNLVYAVAGRHAGWPLAFLPAVALVAAARRGSGGLALVAAVGASLGFRLFLQPFTWAGAVAGPAQLGLLPLYAALWLLPERPWRPLPGIVLLAASGLSLWPLWLAPRSGDPTLAFARGPAAPLLARLPVETSLRELPGAVEREQAGVAVRAFAPAIEAAAGGELRLRGPGAGTLLVASPRRLTGLRLAFDEQAPSGLRVMGAELGATILRPAGGIEFDLLLDRPRVRHASPWGGGEALFYPLRLQFAGALTAPVGFRVVTARTAVPAAEGEP